MNDDDPYETSIAFDDKDLDPLYQRREIVLQLINIANELRKIRLELGEKNG